MQMIFRQIPNLLSGWRLVTFPFLLWLIFSERKDAFVVLLSINLVTDILDGLIARLFKLQTEFGAQLDSIADIGTYIAAFVGLLHFHYAFYEQMKSEFILIAALWMAGYVISFVRFKRPPHLHLYSTKIAGYVQGIFLFVFFNCQISTIYFYIMCIVSILAFVEEIIVLLRIPRLRSNVKGIYWMIRTNGKIE